MNEGGVAQGLPRVTIAVPSGDMVHTAFAMALAELYRASHGLTVQLANVRSSIVALARNNAVDTARAFGADYLMFIDSDMVFPPNTLLRLLIHRRDIVGGTYVKRVPPFDVLGSALDPQQQPAEHGLIEMRRIPTGCLLIATSVFDALPRPYFHFAADRETGVITGEDYAFCDAAREAGFRLWCDAALSAELGHVGQSIHRLPTTLDAGPS